jgi:hypothetical protein
LLLSALHTVCAVQLEVKFVTDSAMTYGLELTFTPQHALLGGLVLGVATVGNLLLNGRVLGISGVIKCACCLVPRACSGAGI